MIRKSIYGPKRLLDRGNFSEYVIGLLEQDYIGTKPEDPRLKTVQTLLCEYEKIKPSLKRDWQIDELRTESLINDYLSMHGLAATPSEISAGMTKMIKGVMIEA